MTAGQTNVSARASRSWSPLGSRSALPATASCRNGASKGSRHPGVVGGGSGIRVAPG